MRISAIKAIAPDIVSYEEYDNASLGTLEPSEVLIKNKVSHLSAGTELACIAGLEDWFQFPAALGYTSIGEVMEVGQKVSDKSPGDLVYTFGPHASHFKIDMTDRWHGVCEKVPTGINLHFAAFTHMAAIAITALRTSKITLGDWVAVAGMGAIGNLCAQLCQLQGANVIAIDILPNRLETAKACGLANTINALNDAVKDALLQITGGSKVNTFIDATGVPSVIQQATNLIDLYGELILLGSPRADFQTNLTDFLRPIHMWSHGAIEVKGALEFTYPTHQTEFSKHSISRNSKMILEMIKNGKLSIEPLLGRVAQPSEARSLYNDLITNPDGLQGVIFEWKS